MATKKIVSIDTNTKIVFKNSSGSVVDEDGIPLIGLNTAVLRFTVANPNSWYNNTDTIVPVWENIDQNITISKIIATCDSDPITEVDQDAKFADSLIGLANATVINGIGNFDTVNGTISVSSGWNDATILAGKSLYISYGAEPHADIKTITYQIEYSYDEA